MITVKGYKEVIEMFKHLPDAVSHKTIGAANVAAAKPLIRAENRLAPEGPTGNLRDSIGAIKTPLKKANVVGEVLVGPRRKGGYKGFAGHLLEFGTNIRKTKKGANRGKGPVKKFAQPAYEQTKDEVKKGIIVELGKSVVKTAKKYAPK